MCVQFMKFSFCFVLFCYVTFLCNVDGESKLLFLFFFMECAHHQTTIHHKVFIFQICSIINPWLTWNYNLYIHIHSIFDSSSILVLQHQPMSLKMLCGVLNSYTTQIAHLWSFSLRMQLLCAVSFRQFLSTWGTVSLGKFGETNGISY